MKWDKEAELLEAQFNNRGLQFTSPFEGLSLMQAYGYLDGQRFYFHLRNGEAYLCVGIYDRATEMRKLRNNIKEKNPTQRTAPIEEDLPTETDPRLFPSVILLASNIESDRQRLVDIFANLITNLKPVPVRKEINFQS